MQVYGKDIKLQGRFLKVAGLDGDKYTFPDDPDAFVNGLRRCGSRVDIFTFMQRVPDTSPKFGYRMEWDNLAVLPVSTFEQWWTGQIQSVARNRARQAEKKGAVIREIPFDEVLLRGIVEIHNESPIRQGKPFPHYGMNLEGARKYAGTFLDRSIFIGAFVGDSLIGFIKLVVDETRTYACAVNILSMLAHREKAPTNALVAQAVKSCAARGISYLVYENFAYGKKKADSLSHFKEVNGFRRMDLPRYYIPLTPLGSLALSLGLHHRLIDRCPEVIMAKVREWRTGWYTNRLRPSTNGAYRD